MKKLLHILLLTGWCAEAFGLSVQPVGQLGQDYTYILNGQDTIYVFAEDIAMHSNVAVDWYAAATNTIYQSNSTDLYAPDDGGYYTLQAGEKEYFVVASFSHLKLATGQLQLLVEPHCEQTALTLQGTIPTLTYVAANGTQTLDRTCTIKYDDLAWDEGTQAWTDSTALIENEPLTIGTHNLPPIYDQSEIVLRLSDIAPLLALDPDSVSVKLTDPIAVKWHTTSRTEVRGRDGELSNELERPTTEDQLSGSGAMRIQFKTNPTPAAQFYFWDIYKGSEHIMFRNETDILESFDEPAAYRVVNRAEGYFCPCETCSKDSTVINVNISTSALKVPNVFTPNGDGVNDEFRVQYRSLAEFHCWIYNRWGHLVYEWTDPSKGWDGTINGNPCAEGAYFYVIRARGTDADPKQGYTTKAAYKRHQLNDETMTGIYQLSGDINLIRGKK